MNANHKQSTITITVNIASADKNEGNSEYSFNVNEDSIKHLNPARFGRTIEGLIRQAMLDYKVNNEVIFNR